MTDLLERRFQAIANPDDDSDWREVRRRTRRSSSARVVLAIAAAFAVVSVAGPASGLHEPIIDFFTGDPAPERVIAEYEHLNKRMASIPGHDFDVMASETREVTSTHLSDGRHTLFVAPTVDGGFCFLWTDIGGACDQFGSVPLAVGWRGGPRGGPALVNGHVDAEWVDSVEVHFADGTVEKPKITWISDPIGAGFFVHEVADIDDVVVVSALDENGHVLTEQRFRHRVRLVAPQTEALVDRKHRVFAVEIDGDPLTVWSAPSNTEGRCAWFAYRGRTGQVHPCWPRGHEPDVVSGAIVQFESAQFLLGHAPARATSVEVAYEGGRTTTVRPEENVFVVPLAHGEVPANVAGRDVEGRDIVSIPLPPKPIVVDG